MSEQQRKCWDCGNVAMHKDNIVPWVLCSKCGSQDTRLVRKPELPPLHPSQCEQQLTAAQQRVAELERENAELKRSLAWYKMQLERDRARLQEIRESFKHPYDE